MLVNLEAKEIYFDLMDYALSSIEVGREHGIVDPADIQFSYIIPNHSGDESSEDFVRVIHSYADCTGHEVSDQPVQRCGAELALLCVGIQKIGKSYGEDDEAKEKLIEDVKELIMKHTSILGNKKDTDGVSIAVNFF